MISLNSNAALMLLYAKLNKKRLHSEVSFIWIWNVATFPRKTRFLVLSNTHTLEVALVFLKANLKESSREWYWYSYLTLINRP